MTTQSIAPKEAYQLLQSGEAVLIDTRTSNEFWLSHIEGAKNIPDEQVSSSSLSQFGDKKVIFYCNSGRRTHRKMPEYTVAFPSNAYELEGGMNAWLEQTLPVYKAKKQTLPLNRQIHIIAGSLIMLGAILGVTLSPWFYLLCFFVGLGLFISGATGFCGMALLLMKMPWNKV